MEFLQNLLTWLFGTLAIIFLVIALISIFSFGSSLLWVSEKANKKAHFYLLLSSISFVSWFIVKNPNLYLEAIVCILPIALFAVGFSYFRTQFGRKLFDKFMKKTDIDYPFKDN